jgi:hypothetical protein
MEGDLGNEFVPTGNEAVQDVVELEKGQPAQVEKDTPEKEQKSEPEMAEPEQTEPGKAKVVPRERLEAQQRKAQARAERDAARIDELERANAAGRVSVDVQKLQANLSAARDKYEDLVQDGKKDEARAVRRDIDRMQDALVDYRATSQAERARTEAIETVNYETALTNAEAKYSELNPEHDDFNSDLTDEVADMMAAYVSRGYARNAALDKALKYVMVPKKASVGDAGSSLRAEREAAARTKAAAADKAQPGNLSKVGLDSDKVGDGRAQAKVDVMRMTQEQFAKLDEDTKAKLRGDDFSG